MTSETDARPAAIQIGDLVRAPRDTATRFRPLPHVGTVIEVSDWGVTLFCDDGDDYDGGRWTAWLDDCELVARPELAEVA
jgi:hypothetical protein